MQKILFLVLVFFVFAINIVYSQIMDSSKKPFSFNYDSDMKSLTLESKVSTEVMPSFNIDSMLIEDEKNKEYNLPFRFGYPHHVSINLETNGTWDTLTNGDRLCRMKINCPGAFSLTATNYKTYELNKENGKYQKGVRL